MFTKQQEQEIQERVNFKLNEILTGIKNRINIHHKLSFDLTLEDKISLGQREYHFKEAYDEFLETFKKEIEMQVPCNNMSELEFKRKRNIIVDKIMEKFDNLTRAHINYDQRQHFLRNIVSILERNL